MLRRFNMPILTKIAGINSIQQVRKFPSFTYTGSYTLIDDGYGNWRIKFTSSGTFVLLHQAGYIDAFLVGGGGGGGRNNGADANHRGGGGGGGHVYNSLNFTLTVNSEYSIVVGAGGTGRSGSNGDGTAGGTSTAFGYSATGGSGGKQGGDGGNGGSGGGASGTYGGGNGGDGYNNYDYSTYNYGGDGDVGGTGEIGGVCQLEFKESGGDQYGDGAPGYAPYKNTAPTGLHGANSGYGGRGGYTIGYEAQNGQTGIVIIRNHR